ncbi:aminotransferase class I/II-fold pyridoxal phosphate-dependent enzyme [Virgibacillus dokdonensis]|uniref:Aminotransferase n=1 Tax=Virgibacillus dokdonensis TaxID=302167 RepID=A0A2K9J120_9BACI|nr:aminotransferase class I/II-fold pyridoxal phosphate-dependent enzyme [Virgibacillus dokdonensis]AUJ25404.1 LL-diaminopimelate aminotransferase [Virgibacillus dokdonensis]
MVFISEKVQNLPPYLFSQFQQRKKQLENNGVDVIDLGIGSPDLPTPAFICEELQEQVKCPENHRYSPYSGCDEFKQAVASYYDRRYAVTLDPNTEVLALIGSKEGIANLIQAVINPMDKVLVPDPGYPAYRKGVHLAGGVSVTLPLDAKKGYAPMFQHISKDDAEEAKMMFLNYPNNPTAAHAEWRTFLEAVSFCRKYNILLAHDAAYDLVTFGKYRAPSALQVPGAKDNVVELGSLSKSFNMTGWRIGYVVGNKEVIHALATLKGNIDTCQFMPIQKAAAKALTSDLTAVEKNNLVYEQRIEKLYLALTELGFHAEKPRGTLYLWVGVPKGESSLSFANRVLEETGIIVTPGTAFGDNGEGFIRISLSVHAERLDEVIRRLKALNRKR